MPRTKALAGALLLALLALLVTRAVVASSATATREYSDTASPKAVTGGATVATATTTGHDHMAEGVAVRLASDREGVAFCASAALEPYPATIGQIATNGPDEATERWRSCLFDTVIGHGTVATLNELETHLPHLAACMAQLAAGPRPTAKADAVSNLAACSAVPQ